MADEWTIYLRAPDLSIEGQIDDYSKCELIPRYNDVGTWQLELDARTRHARKLRQPGYGIEVWRDDSEFVLGGPLIKPHRKREGHKHTLTVSGRDDNVWLARRLAYPQPAKDQPPYDGAEHDVRNGTASTVLRAYVNANLGPSAPKVRRVPGLTLASDPLVGGNVFGRARWQNLLEVLQGLAVSGGVGFRIRKVGAGLVFDVYAPQDRTATVRFSEDLGTLAGYEHSVEVPEVTYDVIGGQGEGIARTVRERQDPAGVVTWGRIERFHDRRDTSAVAELDQEASKNLAEGAEKIGISITPIDTPTQRYLRDYDLGDLALCVLDDDEVIAERIREIKINLTPGDSKVVPVIGSTARVPVLQVFRQLRSLAGRITNMERR